MSSAFPPTPSTGTGPALAVWIKEQARALGFHRAGIAAPPPDPAAAAFYRRWLDQGLHGEMAYLARPEAVTRRMDPAETLQGVQSVVVVTHRYPRTGTRGDAPRHPVPPDRGVVARYARGQDYHEVIQPRLQLLHRRLEDHLGRAVRGRAYTDAGPLLERDLAQRAGLGWAGKNTMLLHPRAGSYELLGALLLALDLPPDAPFEREHCGRCTRCLDACPTAALLGREANGAPVMDARRCISYLTIELKGPIPRDLRPLMGNRIFGCDICQEVCPWNGEKSAAGWPAPEAAYSPREALDGPELLALGERILGMSGKAFLRAFADSPVARARRQGMLRNVAVALGNGRPEGAADFLVRALADRHPLVRGHAAWALGEVGTGGRTGAGAPAEALELRLRSEEDPWVRDEIEVALV